MYLTLQNNFLIEIGEKEWKRKSKTMISAKALSNDKLLIVINITQKLVETLRLVLWKIDKVVTTKAHTNEERCGKSVTQAFLCGNKLLG